MAKTIGVTVSEHIQAGLIVDHKVVGELQFFPPDPEQQDGLVQLHPDALVQTICDQIIEVAKGATDIQAVGVAVPGLVRNGVVEEAPNLPQLKGARIKDLLVAELARRDIKAPVTVLNDADGCAAGLAARTGQLASLIRVWTIGGGIRYRRH